MTTRVISETFPAVSDIAKDISNYRPEMRGLDLDRGQEGPYLDEERRLWIFPTVALWIVPARKTIVGRTRGWGGDMNVARAIGRVQAGNFTAPRGLADWDRTSLDGDEALHIRLMRSRSAVRCNRPGCVHTGEWFPEGDHLCEVSRTAAMVQFGLYISFEEHLGEWRLNGFEYSDYSGGDAREFARALEAAAEVAERLNKWQVA
ncbi:hypothetical protein GCM10011490_24050 [Pseudoclavibacter endophyticus]|uniref:Uncharacterized protein n=1 Tax=Pseudoclavibacter endophyticus TaxID=1778590 RepID=A0A6H9WKW2_9MICO|nr:hypothetical protein [Pseudoclavibacter endophyticus]KAB1648409.1 hypothetical protein F8O04_12045 [Pseudoclavibacter endophyticus]GGA72451.1 hypothetical protein GCM10011490_24050 [Pseudoclavibacter endophyticus]